MSSDEKNQGKSAVCFWPVIGIVLLLLLAWQAIDMLLVVFTGILLALFLRGLGEFVCEHLHWSYGWSLAAVILGLLIITAVTGSLLAPEISRQAANLTDQLPQAVSQLEDQLRASSWGQQILRLVQVGGKTGISAHTALSRASGVLSSSFGFLAGVVVAFFVGIYVAVAPSLYSRDLIRLFPPNSRPRAREVLDVTGRALQRWLVGRVMLMVLNGIVTALGLWLLGVPLALTLGILSGLLNFVPNLGPIVAGAPAVLLAFMKGPTQALYVILFYVGYQALDGYVLTPLVQRKTVALPPAITIGAQAILAVLLGTTGVLLAVPLTVIGVILVKMLYLRDSLGETVHLPGTS